MYSVKNSALSRCRQNAGIVLYLLPQREFRIMAQLRAIVYTIFSALSDFIQA